MTFCRAVPQVSAVLCAAFIGVIALSGRVLCEQPVPDKDRGARLIEKYQCGRCHELPYFLPQWPRRTSCTACHQAVLRGEIDGHASAGQIRAWKQHIVSLTATPSLADLPRRLSREWVEQFLIEPYPIRPLLIASMPRLPISPEDARAITETLYGESRAGSAAATADGDVTRGLGLLQTRGCLNCHAYSGVFPNREVSPPAIEQRTAPDLRFARDRMSPRLIAARIDNPKSVDSHALMPALGFSASEIADLTAALTGALLERVETPPQLPDNRSTRDSPAAPAKIDFPAIQDRILNKTCRHCHSNPDRVGPEAGPGNTGGFGYPGKGLDLTSEAGLLRGVLDRTTGRRTSILTAPPGKDPRIIEVLRARHSELRGTPIDGVLGMPLGLPPIPETDITLFEEWIAQQHGAAHGS